MDMITLMFKLFALAVPFALDLFRSLDMYYFMVHYEYAEFFVLLYHLLRAT